MLSLARDHCLSFWRGFSVDTKQLKEDLARAQKQHRDLAKLDKEMANLADWLSSVSQDSQDELLAKVKLQRQQFATLQANTVDTIRNLESQLDDSVLDL
jgi:t-SNARE complex subunit (syntaxin)